MADELGTDAPETGADAEGAEASDPFENEQVQTFDRTYVEKLRREAADHRTARREYEKAFEGWTSEDRDVWLDTVKLSTQAPESAAERLRQIADLLSPAERREALKEADRLEEEAEEEGEYLTKTQLEERFASERNQREVDDQVKEIQRVGKSLGYEPGTEQYFRLMWVANNQTKGDLKKAHEAIENDRQKIIDDYIAQKQEQALGPRAVRRGTATVSNEKPIKSFADAREALEAHIAAMK